MSKKRIVIVCIIALLMVVAGSSVLYVRYCTRSREIGEELGITKEQINSAAIQSGSNGSSIRLSQSELDKVYQDIAKISIKPSKDEKSTGWNYKVEFICGDQEYGVTIIGPTRLVIDGTNFEVADKDGSILFDEIEKIYKSKTTY
jgi:hypothetical protein